MRTLTHLGLTALLTLSVAANAQAPANTQAPTNTPPPPANTSAPAPQSRIARADNRSLQRKLVARRSGWERSGNQDKNPVSRHWHDCRGVMVAQAELRFWMSRRGDQALAAIVAWIGGRPRLRLRSSAARRR